MGSTGCIFLQGLLVICILEPFFGISSENTLGIVCQLGDQSGMSHVIQLGPTRSFPPHRYSCCWLLSMPQNTTISRPLSLNHWLSINCAIHSSLTSHSLVPSVEPNIDSESEKHTIEILEPTNTHCPILTTIQAHLAQNDTPKNAWGGLVYGCSICNSKPTSTRIHVSIHSAA